MKFGEFASSPMSQSLKVGDTKEKSALRKNKFWTKTWFLGSVGWVRVRLGVRKRSIEVVYDPVRSRWGSTCRVTAVSSVPCIDSKSIHRPNGAFSKCSRSAPCRFLACPVIHVCIYIYRDLRGCLVNCNFFVPP